LQAGALVPTWSDSEFHQALIGCRVEQNIARQGFDVPNPWLLVELAAKHIEHLM
jgi:hypothetical protein